MVRFPPHLVSLIHRNDKYPREPAPIHSYERVELGNVGYIRRGHFHLLFSAGCPLGTRRPGRQRSLHLRTVVRHSASLVIVSSTYTCEFGTNHLQAIANFASTLTRALTMGEEAYTMPCSAMPLSPDGDKPEPAMDSHPLPPHARRQGTQTQKSSRAPEALSSSD